MERWKLFSYLISLSVLLLYGLTCGVPPTKRSITVEPSKDQVKTFSSKTIRLTVDYEGDLEKDPKTGVELRGFIDVLPRIHDLAEETLEGTGCIEVVGLNEGSFDGTLNIAVRGKACLCPQPLPLWLVLDLHFARRTIPEGVVGYEATIKGEISYTASGKKHTTRFEGYPYWTRDQPYSTPDHAPFVGAWELTSVFFINSLTDIFFKRVIPSLWGTEKMEPLIASLEHPYWYFRLRAVKSLRKIKDPGAVEPLIRILKGGVGKKTTFSYLRAAGLYDHYPDSLLDALSEGQEDEDVKVRKEAAIALRELKHPRAIEPLIGALNDEDKDVRKQARKALKKITGQDLGKNPVQWQEWWEKNKTKYHEIGKGK